MGKDSVVELEKRVEVDSRLARDEILREGAWRKLNGQELVPKVIRGVRFEDGGEVGGAAWMQSPKAVPKPDQQRRAVSRPIRRLTIRKLSLIWTPAFVELSSTCRPERRPRTSVLAGPSAAVLRGKAR